MGVINLNRKTLLLKPINKAVNDLIERAEPPDDPNLRQYLGASGIGSECLRRTQYDWQCDPQHKTRTRDIFARGHFHEELSKQHLSRAGFKFEPDENKLKFSTADGQFRGHADGCLIDGPRVEGLIYPAIFEHKCVNRKGWNDLERDGLIVTYPHYAVQIYLYQGYLDLTNPALVTVVNADTCERLHLLLPYDPARAQLYSDRAVGIIKATRAGELLPRFTTNPDDYRCKNFCGHYIRCWGHAPGGKVA
jgi:hypothetical protein